MRIPVGLMVSLLAAAVVTACSADSPLAATPTDATVMQVIAATPVQIAGEMGLGVDVTPTVRLLDSKGRPAPAVWIEFTVTKGGGRVTNGRSLTNAMGFADAGTWILGESASENELAVSVAGVVRLTFTATAAPRAIDSALAKVRLVFERTAGGRSHLFTINGDGTEARQLTDGPFDDADPAVSLDGSTIVFTRDGSLALVAADGSDIRPLNSGRASDPVWSPDASNIAFSDSAGGIAVMNLANGHVRHLTTGAGANDSRPSWSGDGRQIAFTRIEDLDGDPFTRVAVMNSDGSDVSVLGRPEPYMGSVRSWASWSPVWTSGNRLTFAGPNDAFEATVFNMASDGSGVVEVAHAPSNSFISTVDDVSPTGNWITITVATGSDGSQDVVVVNPTGRSVVVTNDGHSRSARFLRTSRP